MRIITFINDPSPVKAILSHLNVLASAPARALLEPYNTPMTPSPLDNPHPPGDLNAQPAPALQFEQRISW